MLGRLLNTAASAFNANPNSPRTPAQLESVTEEEHTSGLLFPDLNILHRTQSHTYPLQTSTAPSNTTGTSSFDDNDGIGLEQVKDFRIIIAQNAMGDRDEPCILLDTKNFSGTEKPSRSASASHLVELPRARHSRAISSSQALRRDGVQSSISIAPELNPVSPLIDSKVRDTPNMSAFLRARNRRSTFSATIRDSDHPHGRISGDTSDSGLLNCIFGSSAFSYRGSSTKMHIVPNDGELPYEVGSRNARACHSHHRRAETFSAQSKPRNITYNTVQQRPLPAKITVLVTRMFSVNLPEHQTAPTDVSEQQPSSFAKLFFGTDTVQPTAKKKKIKEKKTPMYAVAIAIQLPVTARTHGQQSYQYSPCGPDMLRPPVIMSTSLDSDRRMNAAFNDNATHLSSTSNLDERIDTLVDYWDIITRTLSHLEKVASKEIISLLKEVDLYAVQQPKPVKQPPSMQRTNQTIIYLPLNCLAPNTILQKETLHAIHRVALGLKIPRVITGQSRWGVWRDEARWISKFLCEREHNFFFLVLITAFLGNHTDWLGSLGPEWHKRRHILQQKVQQDNELSIPNRTVIISPCKMTARRLIFVLSTFLPSQQRSDTLTSPFRPSTSTSLRQMSRSPPNPQFFRRESLRRSLNRRARTRNFVDENSSFKRSASVSSNETMNVIPDDFEFMTAPAQQGRRDSDARSVRTASLPIPSNGMRVRKSSTAIAAPALPGTATPIPHFASQRPSQARVPPGAQASSVSAASANLMQTLRRNESNPGSAGSDYPAGSKWGSLLSGFWTSRETSLTDKADNLSSRQAMNPSSPSFSNRESPVSMFGKSSGEFDSIRKGGQLNDSDIPANVSGSDAANDESEGNVQPQDTEESSPASPVKLFVEANDGVVDVELPLPGFLSLSSSNDSAIHSPRKFRDSITSLDIGPPPVNDSPFPNGQKDHEKLNSNVAGWLKRYHEDFVLQAVRPYPSLEADIRRSMSAEPTPNHIMATLAPIDASGSSEQWVEVCSTLIADTTSSTVKRLRLRRKIASVRPHMGLSSAAMLPLGERKASLSTFNLTSSTAVEFRFVEEEFIEEPVMDLDGTLVDAVERVLARSGPPSVNHSRNASPSRGRRGRPGPSQLGDRQPVDSMTTMASSGTADHPSFEVPRNEYRRMVLGALEEVVRSVAAERRREDSMAKIDGSDIKSPGGRPSRKGIGIVADNTLREGIRKWLMEIEEIC
ncbi:hypothetical protein LOZ13_005175 [Ophidiomyces ophidiicola]|nr:hypothetical protein LOZ13_005175 [Ophidiomyces ophidiicola]